jgi:hypothetical protein
MSVRRAMKSERRVNAGTVAMTCVEENGEVGLYVVGDGVRIAKRGHPDTPQARTWVSLEPGWSVRDGGGRVESGVLEIEYTGPRTQ